MLQNKVALITGGSRGLGKAVVQSFVDKGAKVAFTWGSSEKEAAELSQRYSDSVFAVQADALDYNRAFQVVDEVQKHFGKIDVLVCNVGGHKDRPIWEIDEAGFDYSVKITLHSCFNYVRAAVPKFIEQKSGTIVSIGSINGLRGREGNCGYCAGKAALTGFIKTVAKELGEYGINANIVAPGFMDVEAQRKTSELIKQLVLDECVIRRLNQPSEIAETVAFLASDAAKNITGQTLAVDNGQSL
jgi:3-oxoacyl-[acyl-carrier protein] reductase